MSIDPLHDRSEPSDADRITLELTATDAALVARAAALCGVTVSQFALDAIVREADAVVWANTGSVGDPVTLSNHDRDRFVEMLEAAADPNPALRRAAERYRARVR